MLPTPDPTPTLVPSLEGYRAIPPPPSAFSNNSTPDRHEKDARPSTPSSSSSRPRMTERYLRDGTYFRIGAIPVYEGSGSRQVSPAASSVYANDFGGQNSQGPLDSNLVVNQVVHPQPQQLLEILQRQQQNSTSQQSQYPMTQIPQQSRPSSVVNQHQLHRVTSARRPQHLSNDPQGRLRQADGNLAQQQIQRRGSQQHMNQGLQQPRAFSPHTYQQQQQQQHSAPLYQYQPPPQPHQDQMPLSQLYPGAPLIDSHAQLPPTPVSATSQSSFIPPPQALRQPSPSLGILIPHFEPSTGLTSFCTVEQLVQQRMQASATASAQEIQSLRDELSAVKTNYTMVAAANSTLQTELNKSNALHKDAVSQVQVGGGEGKDSAEVLSLRQEIEDVKNKFNQLLFANNSLKSEHKGVQSLYRDAVSKNRVIEREREVSDLKKESNGRLETIKSMLLNQTAIEARENDAKLEAGKAKLQLANLQTNHTRKLEELDTLRTQCTEQSTRLVETNAAALKSGCEIFSLRTKLESAIAQHTKESQDTGIRIAEMTLTNRLLSERIKVLEATSSSTTRPDTPPLPSADTTSTAALVEEKTRIIADLQLEISQLKTELDTTRSELTKADKQESGFPWEGCASGEGDGEQEQVKAKLLSQETRIQDLSAENAALILELDRNKNAFELEKVQNEWISNKRKTNEIQARLSITIDDTSPPSSPTTDNKSQAVKGCGCKTTLPELILRSEKVYVETLILASYVKSATRVMMDDVPLANTKARRGREVIMKNTEMIENLVKYAREGVPSGV